MPLADTLDAATQLLEKDGYQCERPMMAVTGDLAGQRVAACQGAYGSTAVLAAVADDTGITKAEFSAPASAVAAPDDIRPTVRVLSWVARPMRTLAQGSRDREALHNFVMGHALDMRPHRADLFGGITVWIEPPTGSGGRWSVTVWATSINEASEAYNS